MKFPNKSVVKFLGYMCLGGLVGGIGGFLVGIGQDSLSHLQLAIDRFLSAYALYCLLLITVALNGVALSFYFKGKSLYKRHGLQDDRIFDQIDRQLTYGMMATALNIIFVFTFYSITVVYHQNILLASLIMVGGALFTVFFQVKLINMTKVLYPNKKGNPLEASFNKEWLASCDEAEKYIVYNASYRTQNLMNLVYLGAWVFLMLFSIPFSIGILPFILLAVIWGIHTMSYMIFSQKISSGKIR